MGDDRGDLPRREPLRRLPGGVAATPNGRVLSFTRGRGRSSVASSKPGRSLALAALAGTGRTSANLAEILPAVSQGRVETLFVATDRQQWGTFDDERQELRLCETASAENEDLLDRAAASAYLLGGAVYAMSSAELPDAAPAAAIYRF